MAGVPKDLRRFLDGRSDVEAVVQRVGHETYDVVFVDGAGEWTHWVVESNDVDKLVIDLRWNGGGNNFLNRPLVHGLIRCDKVNQPGKLFVIVGRNTFSAAQCGATQIERYTDATFVGEPTGSCPNFVGESVMLELPYSKMTASISDLYWQNSVAMDYRTWIGPQI